MVERTFGDVLRSELRNKGVSAAQLSRRSGVTKQHLSKLLNNERSTRTGTVTKPSVETVHKIARGLGWNIDEALLAAGYAPKTITRRPETIPELVAALEQLGIEAPQILPRAKFVLAIRVAVYYNLGAFYETHIRNNRDDGLCHEADLISICARM